MKKKVYIISHSHWDREWYLPYEQHHMLLVELMDDLLEIFETRSKIFCSISFLGNNLILFSVISGICSEFLLIFPLFVKGILSSL